MSYDRGIEVTLHDGQDHTFPSGRSWSCDHPDGHLSVLDESGEVIALIAAARWSVVGYRPPQVVRATA